MAGNEAEPWVVDTEFRSIGSGWSVLAPGQSPLDPFY